MPVLDGVVDVQAQTVESLHSLTHFRLLLLDALLVGKPRRWDRKRLRELAQELLDISDETLYRDTSRPLRVS